MFWTHIHCCWKPKTATGKGIYVTNSSRPQSSCDPFAVIIRQIWINVSQISPTFFRRAFIENNSWISSVMSLEMFWTHIHCCWKPKTATGKGIYVTNSSRPQSSCDPFAVIIRQIWINVSQISPTFFRRAFIENNSWISSDRESQRHYKVKVGAFNYTYYKPSTFKDNHLV